MAVSTISNSARALGSSIANIESRRRQLKKLQDSKRAIGTGSLTSRGKEALEREMRRKQEKLEQKKLNDPTLSKTKKDFTFERVPSYGIYRMYDKSGKLISQEIDRGGRTEPKIPLPPEGYEYNLGGFYNKNVNRANYKNIMPVGYVKFSNSPNRKGIIPRQEEVMYQQILDSDKRMQVKIGEGDYSGKLGKLKQKFDMYNINKKINKYDKEMLRIGNISKNERIVVPGNIKHKGSVYVENPKPSNLNNSTYKKISSSKEELKRIQNELKKINTNKAFAPLSGGRTPKDRYYAGIATKNMKDQERILRMDQERLKYRRAQEKNFRLNKTNFKGTL